MKRAVAINGSPSKARGSTAMLLAPLLQGMEASGYEVDLFYAKDLNVRSCSCDSMYCWYKEPGKCCITDAMDSLYPRLWEAETWILATPVYVPLPGEMQSLINRLCPLMEPLLEFRDGRTRARARKDVKLRKILLVATGAWYETGNFDTVVRIASELAADASVEFAGAVIRPHAGLMQGQGGLTEAGKAVLQASRKAGEELAQLGAIRPETLAAISQPLISEEQLRSIYNQMIPQD
jgi:multimeric flavodoxin WrbA